MPKVSSVALAVFELRVFLQLAGFEKPAIGPVLFASCEVALLEKDASRGPPPKETLAHSLAAVHARPPASWRLFEHGIRGHVGRPVGMDRSVGEKELALLVVEALDLGAVTLVVLRLEAKRTGRHAATSQCFVGGALRCECFEWAVDLAGSVLTSTSYLAVWMETTELAFEQSVLVSAFESLRAVMTKNTCGPQGLFSISNAPRLHSALSSL